MIFFILAYEAAVLLTSVCVCVNSSQYFYFLVFTVNV